MGKKADLVKSIVKSADFWVRLDAIGTGVAVGAEAGLLAWWLPALPIALGVLGGVAAVGLAACAAYSLYVGTTGTISFLKEAWHKIYRPDKPYVEKPSKTLAERLKQHPKLDKIARKIAGFGPVKKLINSKLGKRVRKGLTQGQRNIFMVCLNMKGSLFVGGGAAYLLVTHLLALPALTVAGVFTAANAVATFYASKSAFDISCSLRVLGRTIRDKYNARKAGAQPKVEPVPVAAPAPVPKFQPAKFITPDFAQKAGVAEAAAMPLPAAVPKAPKAPQPSAP